MTGHDLLAELRCPDAHPQKRLLVAIADRIFPGLDARDLWYVKGILGQVDDVMKGAEAPWLSRLERTRIEEAAKELA